jgi:hypothetical protein
MNIPNERDVDPIAEMTRIVQEPLDLVSWGFIETFRSVKPEILIYDSEWCRMKLLWGGWDPLGGNSIQIRYGRLHAPNKDATMFRNGEECRCWHDFSQVLHFLDHRTPAEAAQLKYSHSVTDPFYEEGFRKKFNHRQPEWLAQMHVAIWRLYGKQFFELFDLRQPDLWQQYEQFLKEVYDIVGRSPALDPPLDKVC